MSFTSPAVIEVRAWGRRVGATAEDPASGAYVFEYDPDWFDLGVELAPIHMPNRQGPYVFPQLGRETFLGLVPLLADALPDRFGNALIDAALASEGVAPTEVTPLDRLAYTANRAMGVLEFHPPVGTKTDDLTAIALADLVTVARAALREELTDGPDAEAALAQLIAVGTSAGGARPKAVIAYNPETHQIRSGQLDAPEGFEHWLIKLDGVDGDPTREVSIGDGQGHGIVEYAYHLMATAAGVEMAECRLLPEGPRTHFLTRRFDRFSQGERRHMISLCGLAHLDFNLAGAHGYEQYLATVDQLNLGTEARQQAFRRVVFNVAAVNRDDHTKNLAFVCDRTGTWSLAPAFDVTFAYNPAGRWTSRHQMSIGGRREGISVADLEQLADRFAVPAYRDTIHEVLDAVAHWPVHAAQAGLGEAEAAAISDVLRDFRPH